MGLDAVTGYDKETPMHNRAQHKLNGKLEGLRQMVLLCRMTRKLAEQRRDQRAVDIAEDKLRFFRRAFIAARRQTQNGRRP